MTKAQVPSLKQVGEPVRLLKWNKSTPITQEEAEARLHQEGYDSFCWYDVPGASYRRHKHDYDECLWILKGEIQFTVEETVYALKGGDRLYLPALTPHSSQVPTIDGVTYLVGQKIDATRKSALP